MALSAWLSEELVRAAAFQGGVPGEVLPPPQSDNTAKDTGPGSLPWNGVGVEVEPGEGLPRASWGLGH